MSLAVAATGFIGADFDRLGRTRSEGDAISCHLTKIDALIQQLNQTSFASRFMAIRAAMGLGAEGLFLTKGDYVHGGDNGHWYVFHRGGRWEPEFNIGMYGTRPNRDRYLRVGIGFNLTLASKDPDRVYGQQRVKSLFRDLQWVARAGNKPALKAALSVGRPIAEHIGETPNPPPDAPGDIVEWLGRQVEPDSTRWVFVGRALSPDIPDEARILADVRELSRETARTFDAWLPVWEATLRGIT